MNSAILTTDSNKDLKLLLELAKKLNIKAKVLTKEQQEDYGLLRAIKVGRTQKHINTDKFLKSLSYDSQN